MDKAELLTRLRDAVDTIKKSGGYTSTTEVDEMFSDLVTDEKHRSLIYSYLNENDIEVEGYRRFTAYMNGTVKEDEDEQVYSENSPEDETEEAERDEEYSDEASGTDSGIRKDNREYNSSEESRFLKMYLDDISAVAKLSINEEGAVFAGLIEGDEQAKKRVSEAFLHNVVEHARKYAEKIKHVQTEELIEEGNIGLLTGISNIFGCKKKIDVKEYLDESICYAMENFIDSVMENSDWESTIIAKTTLLNEASKYLAEELARIATAEELSEYTKIPVDEINEILGLSLDSVKLGEGDIR